MQIGLKMITYSKKLAVIAEPDVLVCGAGLAGIGAAVAEARGGAKTMVAPQYGLQSKSTKGVKAI